MVFPMSDIVSGVLGKASVGMRRKMPMFGMAAMKLLPYNMTMVCVSEWA